MKNLTILGLGLLASVAQATPPTVVAPPTPGALEFVANRQQWATPVLFAADVPGGRLFLEKGRLTQALYDDKQLDAVHHKSAEVSTQQRIRAHAYSTTFVGANPQAQVQGQEPLPGYSNFFIGNDPAHWASHVPGYADVRYQALYPGIDLHFYSKARVLEYDFEVAAGADAARIALRYDGQTKISVVNGALHIGTTVGTVVEQRPYAYQLVNGVRVAVPCAYALTGNTVRFAFSQSYNHALPLVIDPVLVYSTYTNSSNNYGYTATYDSLGNLYAGGSVFASGYPTSTGAYDVSHNGSIDMGIIKYNPAAASGPASRVYATYVGGSSDDHPHSLVVDRRNNLIILGSTGSNNYPTTPGAYDTSLGGTADIVLTKLNASGSALLGSTYLGGNGTDGRVIGATNVNYGDSYRGDVTVDANSNIYIASITSSTNFPVTAASFQSTSGGGDSDGVVCKLNPLLTALTWSNYLGGSASDAAYSVQLDSVNNVFVGGGTASRNFPGTVGGYHSLYQGGTTDGFVARISAAGDDLVQATYLGTSGYDQAHFVQLNKRGEVYAYGQTDGAYPVSAGVYSNAGSRQFIHKLTPRLTNSIFSTVIGNGPLATRTISPTAFLVDNCGQILISGWGDARNMPTTANAIQATGPTGSGGSFGYFYIGQLSANAATLVYGSYFGNGSCHVDGGTSRFDKRGIIYQSMCVGGGTTTIPTTPNAWSRSNGSSWNNAAFKIDVLQLDPTFTPSVVANGPAVRQGCAPIRIYFDRRSASGTGARWSFGNGQTSTIPNAVSALYTAPGTYVVRLTVFDSTSCVQSLSSTDTVRIFGLPRAAAGPDRNLCPGGSVTITTADAGTGTTYSWFPPTGLNTNMGRVVTASPTTTTSYIVRARTLNGCSGEDTVVVNVAQALRLQAQTNTPNALVGATVEFTAAVQSVATSYRWEFGDGQTATAATAATSHAYSRPGNYEARLVASFGVGCAEEARIPVVVRQPALPNIITPNGDTFNDTFRPFVSFNPVSLRVFNRWGRLVFEQNNYTDGWGSGSDVAPGVYFYQLSDAAGQSWKGTLEVVK